MIAIGGAICSALALFRLAVQHKVTFVALKNVNAGYVVGLAPVNNRVRRGYVVPVADLE